MGDAGDLYPWSATLLRREESGPEKVTRRALYQGPKENEYLVLQRAQDHVKDQGSLLVGPP